MTNLPAKSRGSMPVSSQSRGIQEAHIRRVQTNQGVKAVIVNKNVHHAQPQSALMPKARFTQIQRTEPASKSAIVFTEPKLEPKQRRTIYSKEQLWQKMTTDDALGFFVERINQNIDEAKDTAFGLFTDALDSLKSEDEAFEMLKDDIENGEFDNAWGGADHLMVTKWGNMKNHDKSLDDMLSNEEVFTKYMDPLEGKLLKAEDMNLTWDRNKWDVFELEGVGMAEELMAEEPDPSAIDNDRFLTDREFVKNLYKNKIPFVHVSHLQGYRTSEGDFVFVPKKLGNTAKKFFKGGNSNVL